MEKQSVFRRIYNYLLQNRVPLSFIVFTFLLVENIIERIRPHDIGNFRDIWVIIGLFLIVAGVGLRSWAAGVICKSESLANTGPYCLTRHPLYVGSLLLAIGFCIIIGNPIDIWVVLGIALILYFPKIQQEESYLSQRFKEEWIEYIKQTAILFPKKISLDLRSNWSLGQWLHNKEYNAFISSVVALVILWLIR
ncbi:MAG: isoprenylcysteine carboxylmethyltransferase family protein [Candidatus Desantisbacteria bacterium]